VRSNKRLESRAGWIIFGTVTPNTIASSHRRHWWRIAGFAMLLALTLAVLFAWWHHRQMPTYQGKTIAEWFREYRTARTNIIFPAGAVPFVNVAGVSTVGGRVQIIYSTPPGAMPRGLFFRSTSSLPDERTLQPFRAMGTNAALWLAREVRRDDSAATKLYLKILGKSPPSIQKYAPKVEPRAQIRCDAAEALAAIATNAAPAVPLLLETLADGTNSRMVRPFVARVLRSASFEQDVLDPTLRELQRKDLYGAVELISELSLRTKQAACVLTNAMVATNFTGRPLAISAFYNFQEQSEIVIPVLTPLLISGDRALVESVGAVLQRFGEKAALALPAVLETLKSTDPGIRYEAVRVLEAMGTNALPARSMLQQATNDESIMVQRASARTLAQLTEDGLNSE